MTPKDDTLSALARETAEKVCDAWSDNYDIDHCSALIESALAQVREERSPSRESERVIKRGRRHG